MVNWLTNSQRVSLLTERGSVRAGAINISLRWSEGFPKLQLNQPGFSTQSAFAAGNSNGP